MSKPTATPQQLLDGVVSFLVREAPNEAASFLRRGLWTNDPIVDLLIDGGLHEQLSPTAMRFVLEAVFSAGTYTTPQRVGMLDRMLDTEKGIKVVSKGVAALSQDQSLMSLWTEELRSQSGTLRYRGQEPDLQKARADLVTLINRLGQAGVNINPTAVYRYANGNHYAESPISRMVCRPTIDLDDDNNFASRVDAVNVLLKAGAKLGPIEVNALHALASAERVPSWLQALTQAGVPDELLSLSPVLAEDAVRGLRKGLTADQAKPENVAMVQAWFARRAIGVACPKGVALRSGARIG